MAPVCVVPDHMQAMVKRLGGKLPMKGLKVDSEGLEKMSMRECLKLGVETWAAQGAGLKPWVFSYYIIKSVLYLVGFWTLQKRGSGCKSLGDFFSNAALQRDGFRRFLLYNLFFEVMHCGCAHGPLTFRMFPPSSAWFHWLCPGTLKLPLRLNQRDSRKALMPGMSTRRGKGDVLLFAGYSAAILRGLFQKRVTQGSCRVVVAFLAALAVTDHTAFLASRGEVYGYMLACHAAGAPRAGTQLVQLAIYFWAGVSKLGPWFPHVIQAMLCNSPVCPRFVVKKLFRDRDAGDLRISSTAKALAHFGAGQEFLIPMLMPFGGNAARLGMVFSLSLHGFIFTNFASGCPQEWNIFTPLAAFHLFLSDHDGLDWSGVRALPSNHPLLTCFLTAALMGVQIAGSVYPPSNSFLTSMKYYAGNWPASQWLVKKSAFHKLDRMHTFSQHTIPQLEAIGHGQMTKAFPLLVHGFRTMHLPYRQLPRLLEIALQGKSYHDYEYVDGEMMAGVILGYNFGDGYFSGRYMLQAVQDECGFEPGELLHIFTDSCPALGNEFPWAVRDATALWDDKLALGIGQAKVEDLADMQPY